jgi:hypothetical protein
MNVDGQFEAIGSDADAVRGAVFDAARQRRQSR